MEEKRTGAAEKKPLDKKRVLLFAAIGAAALLVLALLIVMAVRGPRRQTRRSLWPTGMCRPAMRAVAAVFR